MGKIALNTTTLGNSIERMAHSDGSRSKTKAKAVCADWLLQTLILSGIFKICIINIFCQSGKGRKLS